jgi:hypothetical protein
MKKQLLILSALLFEAGVLVAIFLTIPYALAIFGFALLVYIIWLVIGKIEPYHKNPYSNMPNWPIYRRSWRIKFALSLLILFIIIIQLDMGFVAADKPWAGEVSFTWFAGSAAIIIVVYMLKDLVANSKNATNGK